jgi:hypothetical protein
MRQVREQCGDDGKVGHALVRHGGECMAPAGAPLCQVRAAVAAELTGGNLMPAVRTYNQRRPFLAHPALLM